MTRPQLIGVSNTVPMHDVQGMGGDAAQDQFIREAAIHLEKELRGFVADARPLSDVSFQVTGPHQDPLQGLIYVHTLAAHFDLDTLPTDCEAYRTYCGPQAQHLPEAGQ